MPEDHKKELRNVVFRKIGRNLVNFQKLELALKFIIVRSDLRGYASEAAKVLRDKEKVVDRKALGWLVQDFFKTIYSNHSCDDGPADERDEAWMSISLRLESNEDSIRDRKRQLRELVKERNLLVHRLLPDFDPESAESEKLICRLDEQVDRMEPHYESLRGIIGNMQAAQQEILKLLEAELRESVPEEGDAV